MQKGTQIKSVLLGELSQIFTELTQVTVSQIEEQSDCLPGIPLAPQAPLLHPPPPSEKTTVLPSVSPDAFCVPPFSGHCPQSFPKWLQQLTYLPPVFKRPLAQDM